MPDLSNGDRVVSSGTLIVPHGGRATIHPLLADPEYTVTMEVIWSDSESSVSIAEQGRNGTLLTFQQTRNSTFAISTTNPISFAMNPHKKEEYLLNAAVIFIGPDTDATLIYMWTITARSS